MCIIIRKEADHFPQAIQTTARQGAKYTVSYILEKLSSFELRNTDKKYIVLLGTTCKVNKDSTKESRKRDLKMQRK